MIEKARKSLLVIGLVVFAIRLMYYISTITVHH